MSKDEDLMRRIGEALDRQAVDEDAGDALRRARLHALDSESRDARPRFARQPWIPATVTAVLLVGIAAALLYPSIDQPQIPANDFDDLVVIDSEDELELLEELEFYVWLDQQEQG